MRPPPPIPSLLPAPRHTWGRARARGCGKVLVHREQGRRGWRPLGRGGRVALSPISFSGMGRAAKGVRAESAGVGRGSPDSVGGALGPGVERVSTGPRREGGTPQGLSTTLCRSLEAWPCLVPESSAHHLHLQVGQPGSLCDPDG